MNNKKLLATIIILVIFLVLFTIYKIGDDFLVEPELASAPADAIQSTQPHLSNQTSSSEPSESLSSNKKDFTNDLVRQVKRDELFAYSRDGNFKDTKKRLKDALDSGLISPKEYYGELAHMLSVTVENPESIVREISNSGNKYGFEVMISLLSENKFLAESLSESSKKQIHDDVYNNKPEIPGFIGDLGLTDVYRYENWIGTLKTFSNNENEFIHTLNDIILNKITDPREAFGMHSTIDNQNYLEKLSKEAKEKYLYYINNYIESYPRNEVASYIKSKK